MSSTWIESYTPKNYPKLAENIDADAVIIGGGIAGTTALYLLAKAGRRAVMIDKAGAGDSATAYTTAFLTHVVDTGLAELRDMFGEDTAKGVWLSHKDAISLIEKNSKDEKIDCEFARVPNFLYANDEREWEGLREEADLAREYGFNAVKKQDDALRIKNSGYMELADQAKFHPLKYLDGIRVAAVAAGARIFEGTEAKSIEKAGSGNVVRAGDNIITAAKVFIATHDPFNKPKELFAHKGIYTTYIIEFEIPSGAIPEAIYEDEENPYNYFRVDRQEGSDRVILGGRDHRHEAPLDPEKAYTELEDYFRKIAPEVKFKRVRAWNGPIIETIDGLAYIGQFSDDNPDLFVATGFSGNGMTYGTMAGKMFCEFVFGNVVPWKNLYDPRREVKPRRLWQKGKDYLEEFVRGYGRSVFKDTDKD